MIQEIINFVEELPQEVFTYNLKPKEGLYVLLDIDNEGNLLNVDEDGKIKLEYVDFYSIKDKEFLPVIQECLPLWMNTIPVSNAKIFNPIKKIFGNTCSPFAFSFNKKNWEKYKEIDLLNEQFDESVNTDNVKEKFEAFMRQEMNIYFDKATEYTEQEKHIERLEVFRAFLSNNIFSLLDNLEQYNELKANQGIYFFLKMPTIDDYKEPYQNYLADKIFNKDVYNKEKPSNNKVYGISDSVSYFNDKKPFLKHYSAPLAYNYRVLGKQATRLWQFFNLQSNKQIPNPMPIFIDKNELTQKVVKIFNEEKGKLGYIEIIKKVLEKEDDLNNYYLIFFDVRAKKSKVADIDFVPRFRYKIDDVKIVELISLNGDLEAKTKVKDVFDFEYKIINRIFNNQLIVKDGAWRKYFDELDSKYYTANNFNQLLKYRKAVYDYVFKSRQQAITKKIFDDIMLKGVLDDIHLDDNKNNDYSIKTKLNIWFSLYEYFDYTQFNKPVKFKTMVNKIEEYQSFMNDLVDGKAHLKTDEEFAFASGQVLYYLYTKSRSGDKSYSRLEPFFQKKECKIYKEAILKLFEMYKHENFSGKFKKPFAEVMAYETDENIKTLLPVTFAGFFSDNKLFADKD